MKSFDRLKKYLIICFYLLSSPLFGQLSAEEWHMGFVVNSDKETIRGKIKYDLEANIIQIDNSGKITVINSLKVFYVEFTDAILKNTRRFYTLPYEVEQGYQAPLLFELMYEGNLSLLAREKIVMESVNMNPTMPSPYRMAVPRVKYDFFFLSKKGDIRYFTGKTSDLYLIMANKKGQIKEYIKKNRLRVDNLNDLVRVVSFYNAI